MKLKVKLRRVGDSLGILIPRKLIKHYNVGDFIDVDIIINGEDIIIKDEVATKEADIIMSDNTRWWCHKHKQWNTDCGC